MGYSVLLTIIIDLLLSYLTDTYFISKLTMMQTMILSMIDLVVKRWFSEKKIIEKILKSISSDTTVSTKLFIEQYKSKEH